MSELKHPNRNGSTGPMIISAIVAIGKNRVIGKGNKLLWKLPLEMKYFKETTMGHHIIMGRKTFESNGKPLPGRTSIVLTRNQNYRLPEGCFLSSSLKEALNLAQKRGETEAFIIGGAEIYKLSLPYLDKLYLTDVDFTAEGDAYFPEIDLDAWKIENEIHQPMSEKNSHAWTARIYTRK
jgi:dihydrofolate reductase